MTSTTSPRCTECAGFGIDRPATNTANYWPEAQGKPVGPQETLCDACASNTRTYCNIKPLTTAKMPIGPRRLEESYRMRSSTTYKGDMVESHTRRINRKDFDFSRVHWADGSITVTAYEANTTNKIHCWVIDPEPTPAAFSCACGAPLPKATEAGGSCIPCILEAAEVRRLNDRRTLTKATGRTW